MTATPVGTPTGADRASRNSDGSWTVDAVVLGAGISGLVTTSVLQDQGTTDVLVLDEYPAVGGNHLDTTIDGCTFDVGSLIFQDDSPLLRHFPELLPNYVPIRPTWGRLNPQGLVTEYPFSLRDDVLGSGAVEFSRMIGSTVAARLRSRLPGGAPRNAREFAERWLGPRFVHRSGLGNYVERFCGIPAEDVDLEFARSRMMWIAEHAAVGQIARRLLSSLRPPRGPAGPTNQQLARPVEGFSHLYAPAVARLTAAGARFQLGRPITSITRDGDGFTIETADGPVRTRRIVSTVPIDRALALCGLEPDARPLPDVTLVSLYFTFTGSKGFETSVLYNFSHGGAWKRLTVYSDFYGRSRDREFFAVETVGGAVQGSVERAEADFRRHTRANGLFDGDLVLVGSHTLGRAYPVYTRGSGDVARARIETLRRFGVESLGRQGGFQYQPTARHSTLEAEAALAAGAPATSTGNAPA